MQRDIDISNASTLRPGLLVSLKTGISGNVSYYKRTTEPLHAVSDRAVQTAWETTRRTADAEEHARAVAIRSDATYTIKRVCADFGSILLCPLENEEKLKEAIENARGKIRAFNREARITRVSFLVVVGRIEANDIDTMREVRREIAELMLTMERGVQSLNAETVRDAAKRARDIASMLSDDGRMKIESAVNAARLAATQIAAAARAGETAAIAIDSQAFAAIIQARTSFLDLDDEEQGVSAPAMPGRAIDLESAPEAGQQAVVASDRQIEL